MKKNRTELNRYVFHSKLILVPFPTLGQFFENINPILLPTFNGEHIYHIQKHQLMSNIQIYKRQLQK